MRDISLFQHLGWTAILLHGPLNLRTVLGSWAEVFRLSTEIFFAALATDSVAALLAFIIPGYYLMLIYQSGMAGLGLIQYAIRTIGGENQQ